VKTSYLNKKSVLIEVSYTQTLVKIITKFFVNASPSD